MVNPQNYVLKCALAKDYAPLCFQLRAGAPLSPEEREFLASFLEGKRQSRGKGATPRKAWAARRHYRLFYWLTESEGDQPDHAYDRIATIHGISRRTAIDAVKEAIRTGHAQAIASEEKSLSTMIRGEFVDDPPTLALLKSMHEQRRAEVLNGTYRDPQIHEVQE
jgi:hypothetical protein